MKRGSSLQVYSRIIFKELQFKQPVVFSFTVEVLLLTVLGELITIDVLIYFRSVHLKYSLRSLFNN